MMGSKHKPRRILIAAECFADAEAALRLFDQGLAASSTELGGLLADNDLWENFTRYPKQSVVTLEGVMMEPPSGQKLHALRAGDARAFQKKLAAVAHAKSVKWSFERRSGELIQCVRQVANAWDILLLGYRTLHKRPGKVVLIGTGAQTEDRAQQVADDLAHVLHTSVLVLSLSMPAAKSDPQGMLRITVDTEQQMLTQLSRINAASVVVDMSFGPLRTLDQLRQTLDAARCPVVVLCAGQKLDIEEQDKGPVAV
jgi:hypothetical protein